MIDLGCLCFRPLFSFFCRSRLGWAELTPPFGRSHHWAPWGYTPVTHFPDLASQSLRASPGIHSLPDHLLITCQVVIRPLHEFSSVAFPSVPNTALLPVHFPVDERNHCHHIELTYLCYSLQRVS